MLTSKKPILKSSICIGSQGTKRYLCWVNWTPRIILLLILALAQVPGLAQELRTNAAGEKIIVYRDGSARYFNDLTLIEAQQKDSAAAAYPVVAVTIEPLSGGVDPTEADLKRIAERKLQLAREAEELARSRAAAAINNRIELEGKLNAARSANRTEESATLQRRLALARQVEQRALADRTEAEQRAAAANNVVTQGRYVAAYNEARLRERTGPVNTTPATSQRDRQLGLLLPAPPTFSGYGSATRSSGAEPPPCNRAQGLANREGAFPVSYPSLLFTHTDENLRPFLDGKEYLRCLTWTSRDPSGKRFLHLKLTFANPNAITTYGFLPENSSLSLHLLNGRHISLQAIREAVGIIDHGRRELNYEVTYLLPRGAAADLRNNALDYVRIFWSSGFEQYEILQVDALRRAVECL
jgi:hypothetical protein